MQKTHIQMPTPTLIDSLTTISYWNAWYSHMSQSQWRNQYWKKLSSWQKIERLKPYFRAKHWAERAQEYTWKKGIRNKLGIKLFHKRAQEYTWKMKNKGTCFQICPALPNAKKWVGHNIRRKTYQSIQAMLFSAIELNMFLWMEFLEHLKIATAERNAFVKRWLCIFSRTKRPVNMINWNWI